MYDAEMSEMYSIHSELPKIGELKHIYLNITNSCNLRCFYCYDESFQSKKEAEVLTLDEIEKVALDCKALNLAYVTITGGEPFLNKNWFDIGKMFNDLGIRVLFSTNGTLLTEEAIIKLSRLNAIVQISLDGDDEIMEFVSKGKQIYTKTLKTVELLKRYGVVFNLNCVVGKHNINLLDDFIEVLYDNDIRCRMNFFCEELNSKHLEYSLTIQEKYDFIMKVNSLNKAKNKKTVFMTLPVLMTPEFIPITIQPACGWAHYSAGILPNGDVMVCAPASGIDFFRAGSLKDSSFKEIWESSELFTRLRKFEVSQLRGVCALCPVNDVCKGACRVIAYLRAKDEVAAYPLCQDFYDAVINNEIDTDTFPIGSVKIKNNDEPDS